MPRRRRMTMRSAVIAATAVLTLAAAAPAAAACPNQDLQPTRQNLGQISTSLLCLINAQRKAHHLKALRFERHLYRAAIGHSRDMLRRHYFAHVDPDGHDPFFRIAAAGFKGHWRGENMSAGVGPTGTPLYMWAHWQDPTHIANILGAHYQWIGLGIAYGFPLGNYENSDTITADFGGR